jgi:hypothetical protein
MRADGDPRKPVLAASKESKRSKVIGSILVCNVAKCL